MTDRIYAPFTPEQVAALNHWQTRGGMHPFTCGAEHDGPAPTLIAEADGWHCPGTLTATCDYRQDWAHAFMAEPAELTAVEARDRADAAQARVKALRRRLAVAHAARDALAERSMRLDGESATLAASVVRLNDRARRAEEERDEARREWNEQREAHAAALAAERRAALETCANHDAARAAAEAALATAVATLDAVDALTDGWEDRTDPTARAYHRGMANVADRLRDALNPTGQDPT